MSAPLLVAQHRPAASASLKHDMKSALGAANGRWQQNGVPIASADAIVKQFPDRFK